MALIPEYGTINYGAKPIDFSMLYDAISNVKEKRDREKRLNMLNIQDRIDNMDIVKDKLKVNQENAASLIDKFKDDYANALTFREDGKKEKKIKTIFGEPTLTDNENIQLMNKAADIMKTIQGFRQSDELMNKDQELYKRYPDKYDPKLWKIKEQDYQSSGIYKGDGLDTAPINPLGVFSNKKLDPRNDIEKKPNEILSPDKKQIIITYPSLDPIKRDLIYNSVVDSDLGVQKGIVDTFMYDNQTTQDQKKEYMIGNLIPHNLIIDPNISDEIKVKVLTEAKKHVDKAFENYDVYRKFDSELIETAKNYGSHVLKLNEMIGKGGEIIKPNVGYINQLENDIRDQTKKNLEITPLGPTTFHFNGHDYVNFIPTSTASQEKRIVRGVQLPNGSIKTVKRINAKTGETIPIINKSTGKKDKEILVNKLVEKNNPTDYEVLGHDKSEGLIFLIKPNPVSQEQNMDYDPKSNSILPETTEYDQEVYAVPYNDETKYLIEGGSKNETNTSTGNLNNWNSFKEKK